MDTTTADNLLKDHYTDGVIELLPAKVRVLRMFEDDTANAAWSGRAVVKSVHVGRNEGSGWAGENAALPSAGEQQYTTKRIPMRYQYGRIKLTAQVMEQGQGNKAAFIAPLESETKGLIKDMAVERGRAIFGDGRGILALQNGAESGVTLTVDAPGGWAGAVNGNRFLRPNTVFAILNPATGALRSSAVHRVATQPTAGTTITGTTAIASAAADNDYVVRAADIAITDAADTSYQREFMGLGGHIDDGTNVITYHNVNRTTYPLYTSAVIANAQAWSSDLIQRAIDLADIRGDGVISELIMEHASRRAYIAATEDQRHYMGADLTNPDGGTKAAKMGSLTFGTIPLFEDRMCPYGTIFGIDRAGAGFKRYAMKPGEWIESSSGQILHIIGTGTTLRHTYEGVFTIWDNFDCELPNTCFRIDGLTVNVAIAQVF